MLSNAWYKLDTDELSNPYAMIEDYPVGADGMQLESSSRRGIRCTLKVGTKRMLDVARSLGENLLFSERARKLCEGLHIQEGIVWTPVDIIYKDKTKDLYWALTGWEWISALDLDRSDIEWLVPSKKLIFRVNRLVLSRNRIPEFDLFFLKNARDWISSSAYRDTFQAEGLTGAVFHECEVS